ncbi:hypothetical protein GCM10027199_43030 [Amycolatopsis magusensis]
MGPPNGRVAPAASGLLWLGSTLSAASKETGSGTVVCSGSVGTARMVSAPPVTRR